MPGLIIDQPDSSDETNQENPALRGGGSSMNTSQTHENPQRSGGESLVSDYGVPSNSSASRTHTRSPHPTHNGDKPEEPIPSFSQAYFHLRECGLVHSVCNLCFSQALQNALDEDIMTYGHYRETMFVSETRSREAMTSVVNAILDCGGYSERKCSHPRLST